MSSKEPQVINVLSFNVHISQMSHMSHVSQMKWLVLILGTNSGETKGSHVYVLVPNTWL